MNMFLQTSSLRKVNLLSLLSRNSNESRGNNYTKHCLPIVYDIITAGQSMSIQVLIAS